jgi:hypothetical protein
MTNQNPAPGWYVDPDGHECERFWDGANWTLQTRPKVLLHSATPAVKEQRISTGWWVTIIIAGVLSLVFLAFMASDPTYY